MNVKKQGTERIQLATVSVQCKHGKERTFGLQRRYAIRLAEGTVTTACSRRALQSVPTAITVHTACIL